MTELSELEITAESQQVLDFAAKYAKESGNNCGTEHILLGLLAYHGTRANAALVRSGATLELVSAALDKLMNGDFIWDDSSTGG
jgi:ATP-dependent Clp protease ATP-binding subunit ClpA